MAMAEPSDGYWYWHPDMTVAPSTTTTTFGTCYQPAYNPPWPPTAPVAGWPCPDCDLVMAPWVPYHRCEQADGPDMLYKTNDAGGEGPGEDATQLDE
jgi:hypothetical protein